MPSPDPLLRMAPGYERYKRISLLYETCLADTFRQVGPEGRPVMKNGKSS